MKRFLLTTATAALIPLTAMAQSDTAEDEKLLKPSEESAQSADSGGTLAPTEDTAVAEEADPNAADADTDMAEDADPNAADTDTEMAEEADPNAADTDTDMAEEADPNAADTDMAEDANTEADDTEVAEGDAPMPGSEDPAMAESEEPMGEADDSQMANADDMNGSGLGVNGLVAVSNITGGVVYTLTTENADSDWDMNSMYDTVGDNWERIGSIQDVVLSSDGKLEGIVAEVGGFLGIGDKYVLLPLSDMKLVPIDDDSFAVVTPFSSDQLTDMENYAFDS